jgi:hypothetical protein
MEDPGTAWIALLVIELVACAYLWWAVRKEKKIKFE